MTDNEVWKAFVLIKVGTGAHLNFAKLTNERKAKIEGAKEVYGVFGKYGTIPRIKTHSLEYLTSLIADKIKIHIWSNLNRDIGSWILKYGNQTL